uniref:DNA mismatch repair protein MutS n=2 Tax=Anthurium amnicola TaxID=1678845 RepID=A0A1D1Y225_9ARAE
MFLFLMCTMACSGGSSSHLVGSMDPTGREQLNRGDRSRFEGAGCQAEAGLDRWSLGSGDRSRTAVRLTHSRCTIEGAARQRLGSGTPNFPIPRGAHIAKKKKGAKKRHTGTQQKEKRGKRQQNLNLSLSAPSPLALSISAASPQAASRRQAPLLRRPQLQPNLSAAPLSSNGTKGTI